MPGAVQVRQVVPCQLATTNITRCCVLASTMATWACEKARHIPGREKDDVSVFRRELGDTQMGPGSCSSSERRDVSNPWPEESLRARIVSRRSQAVEVVLLRRRSRMTSKLRQKGGQVVTCRPIALEYTRFVK